MVLNFDSDPLTIVLLICQPAGGENSAYKNAHAGAMRKNSFKKRK